MQPIGKEPQFDEAGSTKPEIESSEILETSSPVEMAESLGLKETEEMAELKNRITESIKNGDMDIPKYIK